MMWIQPRIRLAIFWQKILREMPFCSWNIVTTSSSASVSGLCQRVKNPARWSYGPAQQGCICVCAWLASCLYVCIQPVQPGTFPNRKEVFWEVLVWIQDCHFWLKIITSTEEWKLTLLQARNPSLPFNAFQ